MQFSAYFHIVICLCFLFSPHVEWKSCNSRDLIFTILYFLCSGQCLEYYEHSTIKCWLSEPRRQWGKLYLWSVVLDSAFDPWALLWDWSPRVVTNHSNPSEVSSICILVLGRKPELWKCENRWQSRPLSITKILGVFTFTWNTCIRELSKLKQQPFIFYSVSLQAKGLISSLL